MGIGVVDIHREMRGAFEHGLRQKLEHPLGDLMAEVAGYGPTGKIDYVRLRATLDDESAAIVAGILANRADAPLLLMIRGQMIGRALLQDQAAVVRWATEGARRAQRVAGPWAETAGQWQWVLDHPDRFIIYARQLKMFLNQI